MEHAGIAHSTTIGLSVPILPRLSLLPRRRSGVHKKNELHPRYVKYKV